MPKRLLVVEDDPAIHDIITELFTPAGYEVTSSQSAFGVVSLARRLQPCAIILDLGLPYRSGASLMSELKSDKVTAHIDLIVVSGLPDTLSYDRRSMASHVFEKPFDFELLLRAVESVCTRGQIAR